MRTRRAPGNEPEVPSGRVIAVACLGPAVVTSGVQGIAPGIPAIQEQFGLTTAQVALITGVYLFPSMFSALGAGMLADRIGARPVFTGGLALFGLSGTALWLLAGTFEIFLALRLLQGVALGAVTSLSVAIIGALVSSGQRAARAQGQRVVSMASAEAVFPVLGGVLLAFSWSAPFAMQVLALPVAALAWFVVPPRAPARGAAHPPGSAWGVVRCSPGLVAVQALGATRFVFKFAVLTYFPVLAVNELGMTPALVGAVLGVSSVLTAVAAWRTERLAARWSPPQLIAGSLALVVLSLGAMGLAVDQVLLVVGLLLFNLQDGVFGVAHNVLVTEMAPAAARSTYIGLTGTTRNVGKFVAPLVFGAITLALPVSQGFLVLGAGAAAAAGLTRRVARARARVRDGADGGEP